MGGGELLRGRGSGGFVDRGDASHPEILWLALCNPGPSSGVIGSRPSSARTTGAAVLLARDPQEGRAVALHVAGEPPGALSTVRFLERAHRLGAVEHPHLLGVYDARTLEGRAVAVAQAPPGRRLDELLADGPLGAGRAMRIARQVASAVDALEEAGAEPPPLTAERIWVDGAGDAHLDGLDARIGLVRSRPRPPPRPRWRGWSPT